MINKEIIFKTLRKGLYDIESGLTVKVLTDGEKFIRIEGVRAYYWYFEDYGRTWKVNE